MYISPNIPTATLATLANQVTAQADLTTLTGRLTDARAALLDRLAIVAAGGAGELTVARVALLSNLDAAITSRASSIKVKATGSASIADASTYIDVTIAAVVLGKTLLSYLGNTVQNALSFPDVMSNVRLLNTTTIRASTGVAGTGARILSLQFEYVEYN